MKRSTLVASAAIFLGLATPLLAAEPAVTGEVPQPPTESVSATKPAETCLSNLRAFDSQLEKDGYWLGGSGYGYGYPLGGYGYGYWGDSGYGHGHGYPTGGYPSATGYSHARPGYEVRTLVVAANVLARRGQELPCEDLLATTREVYKNYVADMQSGGMPMANVPGWRQQQISAALPVTSKNSSFRSDQLLGTEVRSPQNVALGSIDDLVLNPQTGKIAYLIIGRGGVFGIGEKYVPVPWENFKVTPNANLLVLDTTTVAMDAAPQVSKLRFKTSGEESQAVDAYWTAPISNKSKK